MSSGGGISSPPAARPAFPFASPDGQAQQLRLPLQGQPGAMRVGHPYQLAMLLAVDGVERLVAWAHTPTTTAEATQAASVGGAALREALLGRFPDLAAFLPPRDADVTIALPLLAPRIADGVLLVRTMGAKVAKIWFPVDLTTGDATSLPAPAWAPVAWGLLPWGQSMLAEKRARRLHARSQAMATELKKAAADAAADANAADDDGESAAVAAVLRMLAEASGCAESPPPLPGWLAAQAAESEGEDEGDDDEEGEEGEEGVEVQAG